MKQARVDQYQRLGLPLAALFFAVSLTSKAWITNSPSATSTAVLATDIGAIEWSSLAAAEYCYLGGSLSALLAIAMVGLLQRTKKSRQPTISSGLKK